MKKSFIILIWIVAALLVLGMAKDLIVKVSVEKGVTMVTGLKLTIGTFKVGIIKTLVGIRNLRLYNPAGFRDRTMADIPEIYVNYDLPAIIGGRIHLPEVRLNVREFVVVKNENGNLNLNSLKVVQAQKKGAAPAEKKAGKAPEIQIDKLRLTVGRVFYKDYSGGGAPRVQEFDINIDEEYTNINDPYALVSLIVVKSLANTTISRLANFDITGLSGTISGTLGNASAITGKAVDTAQVAVKQTQEAAKTAQETVKQTAGALQDILKNPFGGK